MFTAAVWSGNSTRPAPVESHGKETVVGKWLASAVAIALLASSGAHAQSDPVQPVARESHLGSNFTLPTIPKFHSEPLLQDGMIAQKELARDAHVGVGIAPMRGRDIHSVMTEKELVPTHNPGVTFVFRFLG